MSLLDGQISLLTYQAGIYFTSGKVPKRRGNQHPTICPYETFRASDGHLNIAVGSERIWSDFCAAIEKPELKSDPRFALNKDRVQNRDALFPFSTNSSAKNRSALAQHIRQERRAAGPILSVDKVLNTRALARRNEGGNRPSQSRKIENGGYPGKVVGYARSGTPPPLLGEHSKDFKNDFGNNYGPMEVK